MRIQYTTQIRDQVDGKLEAHDEFLAFLSAQLGDRLYEFITPSALASGDTNNYAPVDASSGASYTTVDIIRQATNASNSALTGIVAPPNGTRAIVVNLGPGTLTLKDDSGSSTASNRFSTPNNTDVVILVDGAAHIVYDATTARWRVVATTGGSTVSGDISVTSITVNTDGESAVFKTTKGSGGTQNIWIGSPPAGAVTTAQSCTALGVGALANNLTAGHAVAIGTNALTNLNGNSLTDSVAVGARAGQFATTAGDLTLVGYRAGEALTTGSSNTIVGSESFLVCQTGQQNVGVGCAVLASCTGSNNVAVGQSAMSANTSGANNVAVGHSALAGQQTGATNLAIGYQAIQTGAVTGNNNIGIGQKAIDNLTTANDSVGIGRQVLCGSPMTGNSNTAVGALALNATTSGFVNVGVGHSALTACTQGAANVAVGRNALLGVTTGNFNTAIGDQAGGGITTGSNNTIIGAQVGSLAAGLANNVIIADGAGNVRIQDNAGVTTLKGAFGTSNEVVPPQITANQNDYSPTGMSTAAVLLINSNANVDVTGFATGVGGRWLWVYNTGAFNITLKHQVTSSATNQIRGRGGADTVLTPSTGAQLYYSPSLTKWVVMTDAL